MKSAVDRMKERRSRKTCQVSVRVRLFGLLPRHVPGYNHARGIVVEAQEGTTYGDLIALLNLPENEIGFFSAGGFMKQAGDRIANGAEIKIFMPLAGG